MSIGPALCGFSMDEWSQCFLELTDELQNGEMRQFYETVPPVVWEANQIADGLYSFSDSSTVVVWGCIFDEEAQEKWGRENLLKLQQTKGVEKEEIWQELYELRNEPVCGWTRLQGGYPVGIDENPYQRRTLMSMTNSWEESYYVYLTDDIRFNIDKEEFEWLPDSEIYRCIKDKTRELYEKGYLGIAMETGNTYSGNTAVIQEMMDAKGNPAKNLWVPWQDHARIETYLGDNVYMYSFVYQKAQEGWQTVLNAAGSDRDAAGVLNQTNRLTISVLAYEELGGFLYPYIEDRYELLQNLYKEAWEDPLEGFIFNPLPIQEEWKQYNQTAYQFARTLFCTSLNPGEIEVDFALMDAVWEQFEHMKDTAPIETVVQEANRQYQEWKKERYQ